MTVQRGFFIVIGSGLGFGLFGGLIGLAMGTWAPDYYRMMFRIPPGVDLNPVQAGLGLGVTQGFVAGALIGLVIVVAVAWYSSRLANRSG